LLVNVANILEVPTNSAYISVEHRVVPDAEKARTTVVLFQDASVDGVVTPLPELLGGEATRYNSMGKLEYTKSRLEAVIDGRRFLDNLKK
jgi:isopenicillin N synthase-like dioxygenase